MSGHTLGPWRLEQSPNWPWSYRIVGADETTILRYDLWTYSTSDTQSRANARPENEQCRAVVRLLSAAPDLLKALEDLYSICHGNVIAIQMDQARAAIAAAKVEQ